MPCGKDLSQQQSFSIDLYCVLNKQDWTVTRDRSIWRAVSDAVYIWNALPFGLLQWFLQAAVEESDSQARSSGAWCSLKKSVERERVEATKCDTDCTSKLFRLCQFLTCSIKFRLCLRFCHCTDFVHWLPFDYVVLASCLFSLLVCSLHWLAWVLWCRALYCRALHYVQGNVWGCTHSRTRFSWSLESIEQANKLSKPRIYRGDRSTSSWSFWRAL